MKIEVRCPQCGKGYLVDEAKIPAAGGIVPCQGCGASITLKARAAIPEPHVAPAPPPASEVCCPRCGLHFTPGGHADRQPSARSTVLLVEDMDYFTEIARDALGGRYELKTAKSLEDARKVLAETRIDLLLLDIVLEGGQDGLRLLREPPGKICPVLLFTAQDESEMYGDGWDRLRALGVDDVVMKGMNMGETLTRKVAVLLGESQPQDSFRR